MCFYVYSLHTRLGIVGSNFQFNSCLLTEFSNFCSYLDYFAHALRWPVPYRPVRITAIALVTAPLTSGRRFAPAIRIAAADGSAPFFTDFQTDGVEEGTGSRQRTGGCMSGLFRRPQSGVFSVEPGSQDILYLNLRQCSGGVVVNDDFKIELIDMRPSTFRFGSSHAIRRVPDDSKTAAEDKPISDDAKDYGGASRISVLGVLCLHTAFLGQNSPASFGAGALGYADQRKFLQDFEFQIHFEGVQLESEDCGGRVSAPADTMGRSVSMGTAESEAAVTEAAAAADVEYGLVHEVPQKWQSPAPAVAGPANEVPRFESNECTRDVGSSERVSHLSRNCTDDVNLRRGVGFVFCDIIMTY